MNRRRAAGIPLSRNWRIPKPRVTAEAGKWLMNGLKEIGRSEPVRARAHKRGGRWRRPRKPGLDLAPCGPVFRATRPPVRATGARPPGIEISILAPDPYHGAAAMDWHLQVQHALIENSRYRLRLPDSRKKSLHFESLRYPRDIANQYLNHAVLWSEDHGHHPATRDGKKIRFGQAIFHFNAVRFKHPCLSSPRTSG